MPPPPLYVPYITCLVCVPLSNPCGVPLCCRRAAGVQGEEQEDAGGNGGRLPGHTEHVTHTPCLLSPLLYSTHYCYNKQKNHTKYNIQKNQTTHTEHTPFVYSKQNKNSDCGDYLWLFLIFLLGVICNKHSFFWDMTSFIFFHAVVVKGFSFDCITLESTNVNIWLLF